MRKHLSFLTRLHLLAAAAALLLTAACDRGDRSTATHDMGVVTLGAPIAESRAKNASVMAARMDAVAASPAPMAIPAGRSHPNMAIDVGAPLPPASDPDGAMLVRHGEASVEVRHVDDAVARIRQTAAQFGGFVANTAVRTGRDEQPSASLEVRVPTAQFDGLLAALRTVGKVERITAGAEDVGEEYVDLGARAANARRVEARLVEMLATRTGKLSDVLTVEQELARVRQEIERHDARLRWLERRAALSSLTIALHEPVGLSSRISLLRNNH